MHAYPPTFLSLLYSASDRSRLRLAAASGLLKLAQNSHYQELITVEQFQRLALTMQVGLSKGSSLSWTLHSDEIMFDFVWDRPKDSFNQISCEMTHCIFCASCIMQPFLPVQLYIFILFGNLMQKDT